IYDELDELKASMDYLFQLALEPAENPLLPAEEQSEIVCRYPHTINAEVQDYGDEVMVTVDMIPGMVSFQISVELVNTDCVKIICARQEEESREPERCNHHEERSFTLNYLITLPAPVTPRGARSSLKNGVLDLQFRKVSA
ncbi:MAG: Hsp20 family protein, partial [Methanoregula sp.]|nr:Hsp20 family protein [Methanoregula sp.]